MADTSFHISRPALAAVFGPADARKFEDLQQKVTDNADGTTSGVAATTALGDATFVTLSPNAELDNEYVLAVGEGLRIVTGNGEVTLESDAPRISGGHGVTFAVPGDALLALPITGTVATREWFPGPFASDAAAATGGVAVGECYRKGTTTSSVPATRMA